MRTISSDQNQILTQTRRTVAVKVEIALSTSPSTWRDMTTLNGYNWLLKWEYADDVDAPTATAAFVFRLRHEFLSLSPFDDNSYMNVTYGDLLFPYNLIRLSTATLPSDTSAASADYTLVFRGRIYEIDYDGGHIKCMCRDEGGDLQDQWVTADTQYGTPSTGRDVELVSQDILDAWDTTGSNTLWSTNGAVGFLGGDSPGWAILPYVQNKMSILQALETLWGQIGWLCKFRWQTTAADFKLVAYQPTRTGAAIARTFSASQYYDVNTLTVSNADVRNTVRVVYRDTSGNWQHITVTDATSVTLYGPKFMEIAEEVTSQINDGTQATAMANAALSDLKDPAMRHAVTMPYFYAAEVGDKYTFTANSVHYSSDQSLGLVAVSHSGDAKGAATTTLICEGQPRGGLVRWLSKQGITITTRYGVNNMDTRVCRSGSVSYNSNLSLWSYK